MDCSLFPTGLYRVPTTLWLVDRCHRFKNGVPGLRQCLGGGVHDACRSGYLVPTGSITLLYGQCRSRSHPRKRQSHFGLVPEKRTAHCRWMGWGGVLYRCDVGPPDYRTGACGTRLARGILVLRCISHDLGSAVVAFLPFTGYSSKSESRRV